MAEAPFALRYTVDGSAVTQAQVTVTSDTLVIEPHDPPGSPLPIDYADIETVSTGAWELDLQLLDGTVLHLDHLAERFDPFVAALTAARNERWIRGLLYRDQQVEREFTGEIEREIAGSPRRDGAVIRLYPASFVALCATADPCSVSFNDIESVSFDDAAYALRIKAGGELFSLYKLGDRFDEFVSILERLRTELDRRVAGQLATLVPGIGEGAALALARVAGHGRAFTEAEAEAAAPGSWNPLCGAVLRDDPLRATFDHIVAGAPADGVFLGLATDTAAREAPEPGPASVVQADPAETSVGPAATGAADAPSYTSWFLVSRPDSGKIVLEVTSEEGHATYVFRAGAHGVEDARDVSRALVALNFAREPIYLPLDKLEAGTRRRYQLALRKLPYLKVLRERFAGRVIHDETWERRFAELMATP